MSQFNSLILLILILTTSCKDNLGKSEPIVNTENYELTNKFLSGFDNIKLISYDTHRDDYSSNYQLKIENDTIKIPEVKYIDNVDLDNKFSKKIFRVLLSENKNCTMADCYNPRHILLFYKKDKLVGFYEFCAECGGSRQSENIKIAPICTKKGDELIAIFKEMKLKNDGEESENYKYF
ncbi:hypothetical protein [Flavobacterium sp.]|uniref:hypothetical protein n=1 Tax=Flavobacterium sp. TaxID=239 RepID=UPI002FDB056B